MGDRLNPHMEGARLGRSEWRVLAPIRPRIQAQAPVRPCVIHSLAIGCERQYCLFRGKN